MRVGEIWTYIGYVEFPNIKNTCYFGRNDDNVVINIGDKVVITKLVKNIKQGETHYDTGKLLTEGVQFRKIDRDETTWLYTQYFLEHYEKDYDEALVEMT